MRLELSKIQKDLGIEPEVFNLQIQTLQKEERAYGSLNSPSFPYSNFQHGFSERHPRTPQQLGEEPTLLSSDMKIGTRRSSEKNQVRF